jgi:DNA-binding transcriptional MerR regulator
MATAQTRLRIDDLAQLSGIPSGTIRFYQRDGLIPPPEREGRVAYYDHGHLARLERVKTLQSQGLPLALVRDLLEREEGGEDVSGWLELDRAVFGERGGVGEPIAPDALTGLGLDDEDVEALVRSGVLWRTDDGELEGPRGILELIARLVGSGVEPRTIRAGTERVAQNLRAVAEAMSELGWEVFAPERERIESDQPVAKEVLAKLERLNLLAERVVTTLFPHLLAESIRERSEPYAVDVVSRRKR